jgi:hypothetical protein
MKTFKQPILVLTALVAVFALNGCGKTTRTSDTTSAGAVAITPSPYTDTNTNTYTNTDTSTDTGTSTGTNPPLSYEFTLLGTQTAVTPNITTDNVLKVKFKVTTNQGVSAHQASELAVTIAMNGVEVQPKYTSSNYTYGEIGETSNVIDLSSYVTPGQSVQITVKNPMNDFYCTYAPVPFYYWDPTTYAYQPVNPLYNAYPGCRKAVYSGHNWSGDLIVQTSNTLAI